MIPLGRIFGFPVTADMTALIVLGVIVLQGAQGGPTAGALAVAFGLGVFASVLVHELGHALAARAFRLVPVDITLHGFGGLTRFRPPKLARHGLLIALAGPVAGLALGACSLVFALLAPAGFAQDVSWRLATINLFWSLFNLLPMYPLDGGSVLYYLLSFKWREPAALRTTAQVGVLVALVVGYVGWREGSWFIPIIAVMALFRSLPAATGR